MQYKIPVVWQNYGYVLVKADNIDEAIDTVQYDDSIRLPENAEYIPDSWEVDVDGAYEINS